MNDRFLKHIEYLVNCDPNKCLKSQCPNYLEEENRCMYLQILSAFTAMMRQKFSHPTQTEKEITE